MPSPLGGAAAEEELLRLRRAVGWGLVLLEREEDGERLLGLLHGRRLGEPIDAGEVDMAGPVVHEVDRRGAGGDVRLEGVVRRRDVPSASGSSVASPPVTFTSWCMPRAKWGSPSSSESGFSASPVRVQNAMYRPSGSMTT